jgi:hypothetical protein
MLEAGLVRSKRDFSQRWCGRGKTYLKDYECRSHRDFATVSPATIEALCDRLRAIAACAPHAVALDIRHVIGMIGQEVHVAAILARST